MALINCPECNAQISDAATACPQCGAPLTKPATDNTQPSGNNIPPCPETHLKKAIILTILCCWPLGIPAIVNAAAVNNAYIQDVMTSLSRRVRKQQSGASTASSQESLSGSFIFCSLQSSQLRNSYKHILLTITLLALGVIYFVFDPSASRIFPKCPVMSLTGLPCAGCGSQRAIHALLHLDFAEAIRYNFLVVAILPFLGLLIFSSFFRKRFTKLYLATHHAYVAYGILAIILLWWVLRIIFGWYV